MSEGYLRVALTTVMLAGAILLVALGEREYAGLLIAGVVGGAGGFVLGKAQGGKA